MTDTTVSNTLTSATDHTDDSPRIVNQFTFPNECPPSPIRWLRSKPGLPGHPLDQTPTNKSHRRSAHRKNSPCGVITHSHLSIHDLTVKIVLRPPARDRRSRRPRFTDWHHLVPSLGRERSTRGGPLFPLCPPLNDDLSVQAICSDLPSPGESRMRSLASGPSPHFPVLCSVHTGKMQPVWMGRGWVGLDRKGGLFRAHM